MRKNETNSLLKMYEKFVNSIISNVITYWLAAGFIEDEPKLLTCSIIQGCSSIESVLYLCCRYHKETLASQKFYQQAVVARIFKLAPSKSQSRLLDCLWSTALHTVSFIEFCSGQQTVCIGLQNCYSVKSVAHKTFPKIGTK